MASEEGEVRSDCVCKTEFIRGVKGEEGNKVNIVWQVL